MKKIAIILSFILCLSLYTCNLAAIANTASKTLTQGIYNARDNNLLIGNPITIRLTNPNSKAIILVIDSDETMEALVRLNPQIPQQVLPPLHSDSSIIIFTNDSVILS